MSFEATHRVSADAATWPTADRSQPPGPNVQAGLEVQVLEEREGLTRILCDNGWQAWTASDALGPLFVAPTGPPPPAAPLAAGSQRPAWLVPAAIGAVVVILIALFAMNSDEDDEPKGGGETTLATTTTTAVAQLDETLFPSTADFASAASGNWEGDEFCVGGASGPMTGGDDCAEDVDDFSFVCSDEFLGGTESQGQPSAKPVQRAEAQVSKTEPYVGVTMEARLYEELSGAEEALREVEGFYNGPCRSYEPGPTVYSKLAASDVDLGDDYIAFAKIDTSRAGSDTDHVWVRFGRLLVHFDVTREEDLPGTFYRDLSQSFAARSRSVR